MNKENSPNGPSLIRNDDKEITDSKEMANTFNKFFGTIGSQLASVFKSDKTSHVYPTPVYEDFQFNYITPHTAITVIQGLDNGKTCGLDGIDVRILKAGSPVLSVHLSTIFNMSITCGKVPKCWKIKRVTPLFKKGDTSDVNNY